MKGIKIFAVIYALVVVTGGIIVVLKSNDMSHFVIIAYLLVGAVLLVLGSFFEKRYKHKTTSKKGLQPTGEKFIDPTSGETMEVYFNSKTGERSYHKAK
jgi:hypothetical protein